MSAAAWARLPVLLAGSLWLAGCGGGGGGDDTPSSQPPDDDTPGTPYVFALPKNFPQPSRAVIGDFTVEQVALGRLLFHDPRMSFDGEGSCVSCHEQRLAFSDGRATALAPGGHAHPRNAQSLTNAVYNARQNWANPNIETLAQQARTVLLNQDPIELGWADHEQIMFERLRADGDIVAAFQAAYPQDTDPFTLANTADALAAFTATLISGNSAYDRYLDGQTDALSDAAIRGEALFFSERLECHHCHNGFNMANSVTFDGAVLDNIEYRNTGLYNIAGPAPGYPLERGNYPADNPGLYEVTADPADMGRFRPPSLRNVALSAPYMHDGSLATLEDVLTLHYARGGRLTQSGPYAGDGAQNPYKDALMIGFTLSDAELADVIAFLESLTDWAFICETAHSDPYGRIPMHPQCDAP